MIHILKMKLIWKKLLESTDRQKNLLDDELKKYRNGIFELFNIIASKIDQVTQQRGFGEKLIKESLVEFDRRVEERKHKRD